MIPYSRHWLEEDDKQAILDVLGSSYLTRGPTASVLEGELCKLYDKAYCVVVANGTLALYAAIKVAGVTSVVSPTITFSAIANAAILAGAKLFLTDVSDDTLHADFYTGPVRYDNAKPAFSPMDYAGLPWEGEYPKGHVLIRDACHSAGAPAECFKKDFLTVGSMHPVKQICAGEGGFILTDDTNAYQELVKFRDNGRHNGLQDGFGLNLHTSDIHAALGLSQIKKVKKNFERRQGIAHRYYAHWKNDGRLFMPVISEKHALHLFVIQLTGELDCNRGQFKQELQDNGVGSQIHYTPLHLQPALFDKYEHNKFPVANKVYANILSIPMYPQLTDEEIRKVISVVDQALDKYS